MRHLPAALAVIGAILLPQAQVLASVSKLALDESCPFPQPCEAGYYNRVPQGTIPPCAVVFVEAYNAVDGSWQVAANPDGLLYCATCEDCTLATGAYWDFDGCSTDYALTYNGCAQVFGPPNSARSTVTLDCGQFITVDYEVGIRNPAFVPANCGPGTPLLGFPIWRRSIDYNCAGC